MNTSPILRPFEAHSYQIFDDVVAMVDCKKGMSLTNSIDYWIKVICQSNGFSAKDKKWIYRDSIGIWDGYEPLTKKFIPINTTIFEEALAYIRGNQPPRITNYMEV
jgi:hypothetical protein